MSERETLVLGKCSICSIIKTHSYNSDMFSLTNAGRSYVRFQLVLECWKEEPCDRPTFDQATKSLEKMMMKGTPYMDFELLDESKEYYKEKLFDEDVTI